MSDLAPPGPILTAGSNRAEADWLGGLPFYLAFQLAGFSGLMILKIVAVGLLLYLLLKRNEAKLNWNAFFIVIFTLMAANTAWQPTPRLLDCWFLFLTWIMTERWCCECHEKVCHQFEGAPHLRTLRKATDADVLDKFVGKEVTLKENGYTYRFYEKEGALWVACDVYPNPVRIEWIFGSGLHALTPVSLFKNEAGKSELLQHIVSWHPSDKLGITLGLQELAQNTAGIESLGEVLSHEKTMGCFGCHTSYLGNKPGEIQTPQMIAGVSCTRCHLNGEAHIKAVEQGEKDLKLTKWNQLTPLESINRCGECHRRSDQLEPDEIHPDNELLIRFAPIGISQSPCFIKQGELKLPAGKSSRFDCTTCHDPHEQASRDLEYYRQICLNCHSQLEGHVPVCSKEAMDSQCLKCHMPAVNVHDNLSFTDHWIRIREFDQQRFPELKFKNSQP